MTDLQRCRASILCLAKTVAEDAARLESQSSRRGSSRRGRGAWEGGWLAGRLPRQSEIIGSR